MSEAERTLVQQAIAGDTGALTTLLREHGPAVEQSLFVDRAWQGVLDAADVMQVSYLEVFMRMQSYDIRTNVSFSTWLRTVAENNLKDAIRGLTRQKRPPPQNRVTPAQYEDSMAGLYDLLGETSTTPSRQVGRKEICSLLENAIASLPDDYSRVIRMYDLEGLAIGDVAKAMGRSAGAIHMLRARGHDRLRDALGTASVFFSAPGA
jgi:RNA polymerase sigma-70 factor (ECF subfamily)